MQAVEPWVIPPLRTFVGESSARLALLMTSSGQVIAQHGFVGASFYARFFLGEICPR